MEYDLTNEGLDIQVAHAGFRVDPVTTDHTLVEVSGVVDLAVVFMSGYLNEEAFRGQLQDSNQVYIQKPFSITSLGFAIRDSLKK